MMGGVELTVRREGANVLGITITGGEIGMGCSMTVPALSMRDFRQRAEECGYTLSHEDMVVAAEAVAAWISKTLADGYTVWQLLCIERPEGRRADGARV